MWLVTNNIDWYSIGRKLIIFVNIRVLRLRSAGWKSSLKHLVCSDCKINMDKFIALIVESFVIKVLVSQAIDFNENSLSRPVITRNHRRLKGFTFSTFHSASLVSCGLKCQRNFRCVSTNFRKVSSLNETEGVCELNNKGVVLAIEGKELEYDEESIYIQFYEVEVRDMK